MNELLVSARFSTHSFKSPRKKTILWFNEICEEDSGIQSIITADRRLYNLSILLDSDLFCCAKEIRRVNMQALPNFQRFLPTADLFPLSLLYNLINFHNIKNYFSGSKEGGELVTVMGPGP